MHLDLGNGHDDFKRYLVLHEFGHVLGLGHEHQSPRAPDFIDGEVVIKELTEKYKEALKKEGFKENLKKYCHLSEMSDEEMADKMAKEKFQQDFGQQHEGEASQYDPDSIMHYW